MCSHSTGLLQRETLLGGKKRNSPVSPLSLSSTGTLGCTGMHYHIWFSVGSEDSESGPRTCAASTEPPFYQPTSAILYYIFVRINTLRMDDYKIKM